MKAQIKPYNGVPTLFLNEQPTFASRQWRSNQPGPSGFPAAECVRQFGRAGVHLYAVAVAGLPNDCGHWCGPREGFTGQHDFSQVEPQLRAIMKEDPPALFHLRLYVGTAPRWWRIEEC